MAENTENTVIGDVVKQEEDGEYCREARTVADGQVLSLGEIAYLKAADSKMYACAAAVDEVQTITPNVETGVDEVHTIATDAAFTAGQLAITIWAPDGTPIPVAVPWNTSVAQTITDWNTKVTVAATVWAGTASVGAVLTSADSGVTLVLTFSGVGFTNLPIPHLTVMDLDGTTTTTNATTVRTAIGEGGTGTGYWRIGLINSSGVFLWTEAIAHDADATAISLAITNAIGSALVVATGGPLGGATPAAVALTWSGAAYTELPQELVQIDVSDIEGLAHVTIVETTSGHAAGGDASAVCIQPGGSAPSGADGTALFIVRGPCVLNQDALVVPTGGLAAAKGALLLLGIVTRDQPELSSVLT